MWKKIQIAEPSALFKPFIQYYKYIESDITGIYKIVPIASVELYFNFTRIRLSSPGYYEVDNPRIHLAGLQQYDQDGFSVMYGTDRGGGFAVVFQPQGFYHLFRVKASNFYKYCLNSESVIKGDLDLLWVKLQAFGNVNDMKMLFEGYFSDHARRASLEPDLINGVISYMDKNNGMIRISQICSIYNTSPRSLERRFRNDIGISPKELLQILRLNKAMRMITEKPDCDMTAISYLSGYYDQAHFIKDIKKITGISPGQLQARGSVKDEIMGNRFFIKTDQNPEPV